MGEGHYGEGHYGGGTLWGRGIMGFMYSVLLYDGSMNSKVSEVCKKITRITAKQILLSKQTKRQKKTPQNNNKKTKQQQQQQRHPLGLLN